MLLPGYSRTVDTASTGDNELVELTFRALEAGFARGGEAEATSALREAFTRRISRCLSDLPSPEELKELPEALQQQVRERQREAAVLREKREAALRIVPRCSDLLRRYRAYDDAMGSPRRVARYLGMSAVTVLVGGALGYALERGIGLRYATLVGIALGVIAFFSMMLQTLGTSRQMTQVESSHAAALQQLREELWAAFETIDARHPPDRPEDPNA